MKKNKKICRNIELSIFNYAKTHHLKKIIATVSGGADSVALLSALSSCGCLDVIALHCNFHLRGEESMRDQHHVEKLCSEIGVRLMVKDFDTSGYIRENKGLSIEMACRKLRYDWFRETAGKMDADRIATGHNADDNIETMLLNLFRGSGTTGLRGMLPDNGGIWRPLLSIHRKEIMEYLYEKHLTYITDSSNLTSDYRRNFIRNEVLPLLRSRWPGLDTALDRSIHLLKEDNKVVAGAIANILPDEASSLSSQTIMDFPSPELLVRRFIEPAQPFTSTAAEIIGAIIADKPHTRRWDLPLATIELRNHILSIKNKK